MSKESNVEKTVDDRVIELINDRPYYICKVNDKHTDLQSQLGSIDGIYGREHDRVNEQYLLEGIKALIVSEVKKARIDELERAKLQGYISGPLMHKVDRRLATLTQEKNNDNH